MERNKEIKRRQDNIISMIMFRFFPYWPLFIVLVIVGILAAFTYLRFTTPLYEASASIIIKDEKKGNSDIKLIEYSDAFTSKKIVENEIEVLRSKAMMKQVVNKLCLYARLYKKARFKLKSAYVASPVIAEVNEAESINKDGEIQELKFSINDNKGVVIEGYSYPINKWIKTKFAVVKFRANPNYDGSATLNDEFLISFINARTLAGDLVPGLSVEPTSKQSSVINLYFYDEDPKRAEDILNELLRAYNQAAINNKNALANTTMKFVEDRVQLIEKELASIERRIQSFKSRRGIVNLSEQGTLFLKNVSENDQKIAAINMQLAALDEVEKYVISKDNKAGLVPSTLGVNDPALSQLLQKLYDTEIQVEKLSKSTGENNPIITSLTMQVDKIRPSILENITNQRLSLLANRNNLNSTNNIYSSVLHDIPKQEQEMLDITRQQAIKTNVYNFLLQKREETALTQASAFSDSRVIDFAEASGIPVSPKRNITYFISIIAATLFGILFIYLKEVLNKKVLFRSEIEELTEVPIAAEITYLKSKRLIPVTNQEKPLIAEQFRQLRAAIGLYGNKKISRTFLVTSSIAGEGKSFVSINLALSLAHAGKKVIILDLDLRNPTITIILKGNKQPGVAQFLEGDIEPQELILATEHKNLFLIPAGSCFTNATELLLNGDLDSLFRLVQTSFDYIVVDTSPIDPVTDAYVLSEYCDTTLFVIRHSYTPKTFVQLLDENNKIKALKNPKIVFNGVKSRGFVMGAKGYGFGHGYGFDYIYKERLLIESDSNRVKFLQ